jgi:hypothetical protein
VLYQLSYRRKTEGLQAAEWAEAPVPPPGKGEGRSPEQLPVPRLSEHHDYRVSRCAVCFRQRGQNFESSIRSGSFFRFFVVEYVRDRQVEHASVMIGRLSFGI